MREEVRQWRGLRTRVYVDGYNFYYGCLKERWPNADLAKHCSWVRSHITDGELASSQLPRVVVGGKKPTLKPDSWYPYPELFCEALQLAISVRGSRSAAFQWLDAPSPYFDNLKPMTLLGTEEGAKQVIAYMTDWIAREKE